MKTYIEISQSYTGKILVNQVVNLLSAIQASSCMKRVISKKKCLALVSFLLVCLALYLGCNLFALILILLFIIFLGILINEFIQYIRFIREM
jgi:hypothetical protein